MLELRIFISLFVDYIITKISRSIVFVIIYSMCIIFKIIQQKKNTFIRDFIHDFIYYFIIFNHLRVT